MEYKEPENNINRIINNRILIVSDNPEIHKNFKKILIKREVDDRELDDLEEILFEKKAGTVQKKQKGHVISYIIDSVYSGEESIARVKESIVNGRPYALIFIDVRMTPGMNGVETIKKIWERSDNIEIVICTAYSDYSWDEIVEELGSSDHLMFLKKPFNSIEIKQMALALVKKWNLHNQLTSMNNNLGEEVRKRTFELEKANRNLQKAYDQKTSFFINLAHETRTPLTLIRHYLEKYISKAGMDTDLQVLKQNIDSLLRNMVNFLDVEKLRRGQIFLNHNQVVNFSEILKNKIVLFKEIAKKNDITIIVTISDELYVKADPYAIESIINNILENAVKYSQKDNKVYVSLEKKDNSIQFRVKDNGIGMTKKQMNNIFLPYYQLSHKKSNLQGIGMGLYIVKRITDAINAKIDVESIPYNRTCFTITFPCFIRSNSIKDDLINRNSITNDGIINGSTPGNNAINVSDLAQPVNTIHSVLELKEENIIPGKRNVLLVDDNVEMLYFIQTYLKDAYNVFFAENVKDALNKLRVMSAPDIIISDIMMDELDGHQFFLHLKETDEHSDIPFIFLTVKSSIEEKLKGLSEGAVDYIYKPFLIEELAAKIESITENRAKLKLKQTAKIENRIKGVLGNLRIQKSLSDKYLPLDSLSKKYKLSKREKQVISLLLDGWVNKEISDQLSISMRTVEFHLGNIYKKLDVKNKIELVNMLKP